MTRFLLCVLSTLLLTMPAFGKEVKITLVQANDVYEMTPVNGGQFGGLARLQTLIKQLTAANPNTYTLLAGDLLSPSAIGTAKVDGERLNGKQMVAVLNTMGWDFATLGNHEFDNGRASLVQRLAEAKFQVISSNVIETDTDKPFANTERTFLLDVEGVKIGLAGITLESLSKDFVTVQDPFTVAQEVSADLKKHAGADIVILLTHQALTDDIVFAERISDIDLILGGHEHQNFYLRRGPKFTPIAKADANARSVYIHDLTYDTDTQSLHVESRLQSIDAQFEGDPEIEAVVEIWVNKAFNAFRAQGFDPTAIVAVTDEPLNGLEAKVRFGPTRLTDLIASSAMSAFPGSDLSLVNAGGIRIDDVLPPGPVTQYDVIRILPFGGDYVQVEMSGDILRRALDIGRDSQGKGSFLIHANVEHSDAGWIIKGRPLADQSRYKVAIASFLVEYGDTGLEFLVNNPTIISLSTERTESRHALIDEFKVHYPGN